MPMHHVVILAICLVGSMGTSYGQATPQLVQPVPLTGPNQTSQPSQPSQEDVKQAAQVIKAAAVQTSQKAESALKQAQATQERVVDVQKQVDATATKVNELVATEDDDSEHALRLGDAKPTEVKDLSVRIEAFRDKMEANSNFYFKASVALLLVGLLCGMGSVISSLLSKGTLSAFLALGVIALVALNSYLKLDAKTHIFQILAATADSEGEKILRPRLHFGQIMDTDSALARLKAAAGAADNGDLNGTLQAFVNNSAAKH